MTRRRPGVRTLVVAVPLAVAACAGLVTLLASGGGPARAQDDTLGRQLYETQCAACHASDGSGWPATCGRRRWKSSSL